MDIKLIDFIICEHNQNKIKLVIPWLCPLVCLQRIPMHIAHHKGCAVTFEIFISSEYITMTMKDSSDDEIISPSLEIVDQEWNTV